MICKSCGSYIEDGRKKCYKCGHMVDQNEVDPRMPEIDKGNNNMLSPKFLVVVAIAIVVLVVVKTIFFKDVEKMPKYEMDYGITSGLEAEDK